MAMSTAAIKTVPEAFSMSGRIYLWESAEDVTGTFEGVMLALLGNGRQALFETGFEKDSGERFFNCIDPDGTTRRHDETH